METIATMDEVRREKERLKKQRQRQKLRSEGQISDKATKIKAIINNICNGIKVRSNLERFGITLDMIPCDHSKIHPDILAKLIKPADNGEHKPSDGSDQKPADNGEQKSSDGSDQNPTDTVDQKHNADPIDAKPNRIKIQLKPHIEIRKMTRTHAVESFNKAFTDGQILEVTFNNYVRDFNRVIEIINCPEHDIISCFKNSANVLSHLRKSYPNISTYKNMLTPIISLCKYNEYFAKNVDQKIYLNEMNNLRLQAKKEEVDKSNTGQATPWSYYVMLRQELRTNESNSIKYLLLSLYTMLPPVRDNYGRVYIVYKEGEIPVDEHSFYYVTTGRLILTKYKTEKYYGIIDEVIPIALQEVIAKSLEVYPRKYLITKEGTTDELYSSSRGGKLSSIFQSRFFKFSINDLRHSMEDYIDQYHRSFTSSELLLIRHFMGHNANIGDLYTRKRSVDSDDYSKYDGTNDTLIESICHKIGGYDRHILYN